MVWKDEYAIGVELIDKQHQGLFTAVNRLTNVLEDEDTERHQRVSAEAIKYLKNYTLQHFADEEAYQQSINYPGYEQHKRQHEALIETVKYLDKELVDTNYSPAAIKRLVGTLTSWLLYHIANVDKAITGRNKPVVQEGDLARTLEKLVIKIAGDLFGILPGVTDLAYDGSFSGSELFFLMDTTPLDDGKSYRFLLAVDELSALQAISKLIDSDLKKVDDLVLSAIEELAMMLATRFMVLMGKPAGSSIKQFERVPSDLVGASLPSHPPLCSLMATFLSGSWVFQLWER